jgi:hypothetical protein
MLRYPLFRLIVTAAVVMVSATFVLQAPAARAGDASAITFSVDADVSNGACRTDSGDPSIDRVLEVAPGDTYEVGICLSGHTVAPDAVEIRLIYDSELTSAPEIEDASPALDDNPDANDGDGGDDGTRLGEGWDCSVSVANVYPKGEDPNTPETDAFIFCLTNLVSPDADLTASPGLLATVTLVAEMEGVQELTFGERTNIYGVNCPPLGNVTCVGATVYAGVDAPDQPEPEASSTAAAGASPTAAGAPTVGAAETPSDSDGSQSGTDDDDDGGTNLPLTVGVIVVAVIALGGIGYMLYRRGST